MNITNTLLTPFNTFKLNLTTITTTIYINHKTHKNPTHQYTTTITTNNFYIIINLFKTTITTIFTTFPKKLI
ncbi:hypothetical protein GUG22_05520, partial [Xanthomonas citri pv. citri]|nr:hypothetical protein [Xanthomonas citri pv. citri]